MKKLLLLLFAGLFLAGCAAREEPEGDPVEFTVMTQEDAPEELKRQMEEKCREGFRLTYEDEGWLYVAVGYGVRSGGGYSVQVCACRETENAIYVHTTLLGPDSGDARGGGDTYPCIVLKMEAREKHVVFQ